MRRATLHVVTFYKDGVEIASQVPGALEAIVARGADMAEARVVFKRVKATYHFTEADWGGWTWVDKPHTPLT